MVLPAGDGILMTTLPINDVLAVIIAGGVLGGILDYFNRFKIHIDNKKLCFQNIPIKLHQFLSLLFISAALGIGGALAIQFSMISIGKFDPANTAESII